jgi:tetratricopeptide (TPR) repeat protein
VLARNFSRTPLAGWLFFCGTLFPVLGFLNVYPFVFSFVADHFQYLASLGIIVPAAAGAAAALWRMPPALRAGGYGAACILVGTLAVLTWRQSGMYRDSVTLYRATLKQNPDCWLAELNLGTLLMDSGRTDEARQHFENSIRIKPDYADTHINLGILLFGKGELQAGLKHLREGVRLAPGVASGHLDLANGLVLVGEFSEAVKHCEIAVQLAPDSAFARFSLGVALFQKQRFGEAAAELERAVKLQPDYLRAYDLLARTYARLGKTAETVAAASKAVAVAHSTGQPAAAQQIEAWLKNYRLSGGSQPVTTEEFFTPPE